MTNWMPKTKLPDENGEYLAAWEVGPDTYSYTVENFHGTGGWETEAFLGIPPDYWCKIEAPQNRQWNTLLPTQLVVGWTQTEKVTDEQIDILISDILDWTAIPDDTQRAAVREWLSKL